MESMRVEAIDLVIGYGSEALSDVINFVIEGPGLVQILGPNGAGKTTLIRTLIGLHPPLRGRVLINGVDVTTNPSKAGRLVGYVPQILVSNSVMPITVWEFVESGLMLYRKRWPRVFLDSDSKHIVMSVLRAVGLDSSLWHRNLWKLSGGERQRALIARALVHDPAILVLDEPLASVDPVGKESLAKLIADLAKHKLVIMTTHDPTMLIDYTKAVILMNRKIFIFGPPHKVLTPENAKLVYGGAAIAIGKHLHLVDHHIP